MTAEREGNLKAHHVSRRGWDTIGLCLFLGVTGTVVYLTESHKPPPAKVDVAYPGKDVNRDGIPDVVVRNPSIGFAVYLGNNDGLPYQRYEPKDKKAIEELNALEASLLASMK